MAPIEHHPYGLFTPVHNEEGNVTSLVKSVSSQGIRPLVWVVVDDYSTDSTLRQLTKMSKILPSLVVVKPLTARGNFNLHLAEVYDYGIREVGRRLNELGISQPYIGSLDADVVLDPTCIGKLEAVLSNNEKAGVAAPSVGHLRQRGTSKDLKGPLPLWIPGELSNAVRLYKSQCLEAAGWIPHVPAHDSRVLRRIKESGWQAIRIPETLAWLTRRTGLSTPPDALTERLLANGYSSTLGVTFLLFCSLSLENPRALLAIPSFLRDLHRARSSGGYVIERTLARKLKELRIGHKG